MAAGCHSGRSSLVLSADLRRYSEVVSAAVTVEEYIANAPSDQRGALELLRQLCREELAGFDEAIRYGMPSYLRDDAVEVAFANQKAYVSFYVLRQAALLAYSDRLTGLSVGKGCIRYRRSDQIDEAVVRSILGATMRDTGAIC